MTVGTALAVTAVVWAVGLIRSVRLRALVYSLPLPMSLVLLAGDGRVDGAQVVGVALLVGFFAVVTLVHRRGGHILLADGVGVVAYVAAAAAVARAGPLPFAPALAGACLAWVAVRLVAARRRSPEDSGVRENGPDGAPGIRPAAALGRLALVSAAALSMAALAGVLGGLVVTFPYAGVLVAVEARRHLAAFTGHVARFGLALVAFVAGYRLAQDAGTWAGLAAGWAAYAAVAALLHAGGRLRDRRRMIGASGTNV